MQNGASICNLMTNWFSFKSKRISDLIDVIIDNWLASIDADISIQANYQN